MTLFVKICGLRKAEDVKAAVSAGADAVGFVFAESVRRVTPGEARKLTQYLPKRVRRVAVMRHPSQDEWQEVLDTFAPQVLQTDIDDFESLDVPASVERWPVIREGWAGIEVSGCEFSWERELLIGRRWEPCLKVGKEAGCDSQCTRTGLMHR